MIGIRVNGELLDITGAVIRMKLKNPMFEFDKLVSAFSFPFTVPATEHNRRVLGFWDHLQLRNREEIFSAQILLDNELWMGGYIAISYIRGVFEIFFSQNLEVFDRLNDSLNSLDLGTLTAVDDAALFQLFKDSVTTGNEQFGLFTVYNPDLLDNNDTRVVNDTPGQDNILPANYLGYVNYYFEGNPGGSPEDHLFINHPDMDIQEYVLSPFLYYSYVIRKVFDYIGFTVDSPRFLDNTDVSKITIYSENILSFQVAYNSPNGIVQFMPGISYKLSTYLPDKKMSDIVNSVRRGFNTVFFFNFKLNEVEIVPVVELLTLHEVEDYTAISGPEYEIEFPQLRAEDYRFEYQYSDDENLANRPDVNVYNHLEPVDTFSNLPTVTNQEPGDLNLVYDTNSFWLVRPLLDTPGSEEWHYLTPNIVAKGTGSNVINVGFDTLTPLGAAAGLIQLDLINHMAFTRAAVLTDDRYFRLHTTKSVADTTQYDLQDKEMPIRLMFCHGLRKVSPGVGSSTYYTNEWRYAYGSADNMDTDGVTELTSFSLGMWGEKGLYEVWWKPWFDYLESKPITTHILYMSKKDIFRFDFKKKYRIGEAVGFARELDITFRGRDVETAEIKLQ